MGLGIVAGFVGPIFHGSLGVLGFRLTLVKLLLYLIQFQLCLSVGWLRMGADWNLLFQGFLPGRRMEALADFLFPLQLFDVGTRFVLVPSVLFPPMIQ